MTLDLICHTSHLCNNAPPVYQKQSPGFAYPCDKWHFSISCSLKPLPVALWGGGGGSGGKQGNAFCKRLLGSVVNTNFHGHALLQRTGAS